MVKTTIKYVKALQYKTAASYFIKHLPDLIQILILVALIFTFAEYRKANKLTQKSLGIAQTNIDLSRQSIQLTQQWLAQGQRNIELAQKSLELAQSAVIAAQASAKSAEQANGISHQSVKAANTPWLAISALSYSHHGGIKVEYSITNNSDVPAQNVWARCAIQGHPYIFDRAMLGGDEDSDFAIAPKQTADYTVDFLSGDPIDSVIQDIEKGAIGISVVVDYVDGIGSRRNFIETFVKEDGVFRVGDEEYDVAEPKIDKIFGWDKLRKNKKK